MKIVKCKKCGYLHNNSKDAKKYHKKQCLIDLKKSLKDPFGLKRLNVD